MAFKQEHRTNVNDRVRIKDDVTHMYPHARVYNEGIVRRRMHDHLGYPLIYIEWDKNHWAYSGEPDRWAIESHFDPVETMPDKNEDFIRGMADLFARWQADQDNDKPEEEPVRPQTSSYVEPGYEEILKEATEAASKNPAFIMLVAHSEEYDGTEIIVPHIYVHSKRDDAALILRAAMAERSAQDYAQMIIKQINDDDGPTSSQA